MLVKVAAISGQVEAHTQQIGLHSLVAANLSTGPVFLYGPISTSNMNFEHRDNKLSQLYNITMLKYAKWTNQCY